MNDFILERTENPHPVMLKGAVAARAVAHLSPEQRAFWEGYLAAMCDATGETPHAIVAWMERVG